MDVAAEWLESTCLPELPATTALVSCTLGDVRRVLAALHVYARFGIRLEYAADEDGVRIGSRVVERRAPDMVEWISRISDVVRDRVEAIVSMLTFDPRHDHVTLAQQPFVGSRCGSSFLVPRMLLELDLPRMYVGALNRTKAGRRAYDRAIVTIEEHGVRTVADELRRGAFGRFQIVEKRKFKTSDGRELEPDTVVVAAQSREALIVDMKFATPPFSVDHIQDDLADVAGWQERMGEYVTAFEAEPQMLQQHLAVNVDGGVSVDGLILVRWPLALPIDFGPKLCAVDWPSVREYFREVAPATISEFMNWARTRPDVRAPMLMTWETKEVTAGEWRYRYSVLVPLPADQVSESTQTLAYRLWEERGRPLWDAEHDWCEAESQLFASGIAEL